VSAAARRPAAAQIAAGTERLVQVQPPCSQGGREAEESAGKKGGRATIKTVVSMRIS
jgi:hypothetical protein